MLLRGALRSTTTVLRRIKPLPVAQTYHQAFRYYSRCLATRHYFCSNAAHAQTAANNEFKTLINDQEEVTGRTEKLSFQAQTQKLLDIVAKSLYSEKEVFVRELISNASDALEKLRFISQKGDVAISDPDLPLEIHIKTDDEKKMFIIQDTGVGLTRDEAVSNLGTIAKSGSEEFIKKISYSDDSKSAQKSKDIIGTFGVGFYSSFMVGNKVEVFSKSYKENEDAIMWSSDGLGDYAISKAANVKRGTKIVVNLKGECYDFSKEAFVKDIITKYSNFIGVPIFLNGELINAIDAIWLSNPREVPSEGHQAFYKYLSGLTTNDEPRYVMHFSVDAPLNMRALMYVPHYKPSRFEFQSSFNEIGVSLYSRKVMILPKATSVMPKWLRFVRGVVDSEDIPLNLSRELLQDGNLVAKLKTVVQSKAIRFLRDEMKKDPLKYQQFYNDFGIYLKEGIIATPDQTVREEIAQLLLFDTSHYDGSHDKKTSLKEYKDRMKAGDRHIYYFAAPSREIAETSPYYEAFKGTGKEVLLCTEEFDDVLLLQLTQFEGRNIVSIENEMAKQTASSETKPLAEDKDESQSFDESKTNATLRHTIADEKVFLDWVQAILGARIQKARTTNRLTSYPCVVSLPEMGTTRYYLKHVLTEGSNEEKMRLLQPTLEINLDHPVVKRLDELRLTSTGGGADAEAARELAASLLEQLYNVSMLSAGLVDDPRRILPQMNDFITKMVTTKLSEDK